MRGLIECGMEHTFLELAVCVGYTCVRYGVDVNKCVFDGICCVKRHDLGVALLCDGTPGTNIVCRSCSMCWFGTSLFRC
jgi:hypothetical protein